MPEKPLEAEVVETTSLPAVISVRDIRVMADSVVNSGLFGVKNADQAMALMLIAQAEGFHPAIAARDYHIIQGKASKSAEAMLRSFQASGGVIEWLEYTDEKCAATFKHPQAPKPITIEWDMARVKKAEISNPAMYKKYPRQMLSARVISEGVKHTWPGATSGMYTPEEVRDIAEEPKQQPKLKEVEKTEQQPEAVELIPKGHQQELFRLAGARGDVIGVGKEHIMRDVLQSLNLKSTTEIKLSEFGNVRSLIENWDPVIDVSPNVQE